MAGRLVGEVVRAEASERHLPAGRLVVSDGEERVGDEEVVEAEALDVQRFLELERRDDVEEPAEPGDSERQ